MFSLSLLFGGFRKKGAEGKRQPARQRATLGLEALEDRSLPSVTSLLQSLLALELSNHRPTARVSQQTHMTQPAHVTAPTQAAPARTAPASVSPAQQQLNAFNQDLGKVMQQNVWTPQQHTNYFNQFVYQQHFSPDLANYVIQYHDNLVRDQIHSVLNPGPISPSALSHILPTGPTGMTTPPGGQWNDSSEQVIISQALQIAQQRGVSAAVNYVDYWTSADSRQHLLDDFGYAKLANMTGSSRDGYLISHDPTVLLITGQWITDAVNSYSRQFLPHLGLTGNYGAVGASVGLPTGQVANLNNAYLTGQGNGGGTMTVQGPYGAHFGITPYSTLGTGSSIGQILGMANGGVRLPGYGNGLTYGGFVPQPSGPPSFYTQPPHGPGGMAQPTATGFLPQFTMNNTTGGLLLGNLFGGHGNFYGPSGILGYAG